jgi:hypothetical protein
MGCFAEVSRDHIEQSRHAVYRSVNFLLLFTSCSSLLEACSSLLEACSSLLEARRGEGPCRHPHSHDDIILIEIGMGGNPWACSKCVASTKLLES